MKNLDQFLGRLLVNLYESWFSVVGIADLASLILRPLGIHERSMFTCSHLPFIVSVDDDTNDLLPPGPRTCTIHPQSAQLVHASAVYSRSTEHGSRTPWLPPQEEQLGNRRQFNLRPGVEPVLHNPAFNSSGQIFAQPPDCHSVGQDPNPDAPQK